MWDGDRLTAHPYLYTLYTNLSAYVTLATIQSNQAVLLQLAINKFYLSKQQHVQLTGS